MNYFLATITALLMTIGQVFWKIGLIDLESKALLDIVKSPYVLSGVFVYVISTLMWFKVLSVSELSKIYPFMSLAYVFGMFAGVIIFKEKVSYVNWIGCLLLIVSIVLIIKK